MKYYSGGITFIETRLYEIPSNCVCFVSLAADSQFDSPQCTYLKTSLFKAYQVAVLTLFSKPGYWGPTMSSGFVVQEAQSCLHACHVIQAE
jgi:hypothetical protein